MRWQTEIIDKKNKILIINLTTNNLAVQFKIFLTKLSDLKIFFLTKLISSFDNFDYVFIFDNKKITFLDIKKNKKKFVYFKGNLLDQKNVNQILWFCFSSSSVKTLHLSLAEIKTNKRETNQKKILDFENLFRLTKKRLLIIITILFFAINSFIFFLIASNYLFYLTIKTLDFNQHQSKKYLTTGQKFLFVAKKIFQIPRPLYLFFGVGVFFDNLIGFSDEVNNFLINLNNTKKTTQELFELINNPQTINNRKQLGKQSIENLNKLLNLLEKNLLNINQKMPFFIKKNQQYNNLNQQAYSLIGPIKKISKNLDKLLGAEGKKKYLIFFANNRELRPGGGFIGSFAVLEFENFQKKSFVVYDVYDADGQLKIHIEPPPPIKLYLNQPHWFLRDSAFSPDFKENFKTAEFFLKQEMNLDSFDGGVIITATAIENILKPFGDLYLPDYKEKINSNNFYLKTQLYSEKNFFPGSIQKKSYLNALSQQIFVNFNRISLSHLAKEVKKSLDEKQIAFYFKNSAIQEVFDSLLWSGRLVFSDCVIKDYFCINNYLFPLDANLGVNKADYFVEKSIFFKINVNQEGRMTNYLTLSYRNTSPQNLFPGGIYKNFFQSYLPKDINIKSITKDGVMVDNYLLKQEDGFNLIGFYFEVQPKQTIEIKIIYENQHFFKKGKNVFQLVFQKQIGALNKDLIFEINLPENISLLNNNFLPLVKNNQIIYNSLLNTDKIFYLVLEKR